MRSIGFAGGLRSAAVASALLAMVVGRPAWAVPRTYTIVNSTSKIAVSGTVNGTAISQQGTHNGESSLLTHYTGSILADRVATTVNTISFTGGSSVDADVSGNWRPSVGGTSGSAAAADYGGQVSVSIADIDIAGRGLVADFASPAAVAINSGAFDLATSDVTLTAGTVDYRGTTFFGLIVVLNGTEQLAGQGGSLEGIGTLSVQSLGGGMLRETLTMPIDSMLEPIVVSGQTIVLSLNGTLVANADFADDGFRYWFNPAGDTFATSTNWNPGLTPGTTETAVFDLAGTYTATFGANATNNRLRVENDNVTFALGTRTYGLTNTSTTTPSVVVAADSGDNGQLTLGGTGTGGTLSSINAFVGGVASSTGQVTVGAGATWNNTLELSIGRGGAGTLTITGGGKVTAPSGGNSYLGYATGSTGIGSVSGAGSTWTNDQLYVGRDGTGGLAIGTGGAVSSNVAHIGFRNTGGVTVSGASTFSSSSTLYVGEQAQGTLNVQSGATLTSVNTNIGSAAGSNGTVTITGSGSTWNNTGSVYVGGTSAAAGNIGTLNINSSAVVTIGNTLRTWGAGSVSLTSGKLKVATMNLSTGTFSMTGGQLAPTTVIGNLNRAGGSLIPGDTSLAGLVTMSGNYTQQSGATLGIELGGNSLSLYDRLSISGSASLAGTLSVSLINSYTPTLGSSFQILAATSGRSGTFTTQNLPTLSSNTLEWLVNYGTTSVTLSVALKGDFNHDNKVDAADYVTWRDMGGSAAQYNQWRANFGQPGEQNGSGAGVSGAAVPEPASIVLLMTALLAPLFGRRRHAA